ncbi:MAG: glycosyltransferase family 4 protein [Halioglobus sp.]
MKPAAAPFRVAYMMSYFPKLTETFVLDEILEMERRGIAVEIFPLMGECTGVIHPEAIPLVARTRFTPMINGRIVLDNLSCLVRRPARYLSTLATLVTANRSSMRFLFGALAVFPKACSIALEMRRLGIRHVHAHFASHPAAAAFVVGRMADIPWSFTAHGSDLHRAQAMLREKASEAAFVVAISEYNRHFILESVGADYADKVEVIHCGVEPGRVNRAPPRRGPLQISCVGTLHEVKGQHYLLQACGLLRDRGIDFVCNLIGEGPDREELEQCAAALGITEQVIFHGACKREQVFALLAQMHIAVAPSVPTADGRREGIPVALMEAAACGLPLVASRLSGIPELVRDGETGYLTDPGDIEGLADAIDKVARTPSLGRRLGGEARHRQEVDFNLLVNVARLERLMLPEVAA